jgi:hypothetical protein
MNKIKVFAFGAILAAAVLSVSLHVSAAGDTGVAAGAGGLFPSGGVLYGVSLSTSTFGAGVIIDASGTAEGSFETILAGTTPLGARSITLEGNVLSGTANIDGSVTFSGTSTVDTCSCGQVLTGVPFTVTMTTSGLTLVVGTTTLPTQTLTDGGITFQ